MLVQSLIGSCLWLSALKKSSLDLYFVFCSASNQVEAKNIMKQSSCYTGKAAWRNFCRLIAVSSYRNDSLCCGDIWCSQPCMAAWGFENKDSVQLKLGLFKTGFFWPARLCLFSTAGFCSGVHFVFMGVLRWFCCCCCFPFFLWGEGKLGDTS